MYYNDKPKETRISLFEFVGRPTNPNVICPQISKQIRQSLSSDIPNKVNIPKCPGVRDMKKLMEDAIAKEEENLQKAYQENFEIARVKRNRLEATSTSSGCNKSMLKPLPPLKTDSRT